MAAGDTFTSLAGRRYVVVGRPATEDQAGYGALNWVRLQGVVSMPTYGDLYADITEPTLDDGRVEHGGGQVDGQTIQIPIKYIESDPGQVLLAANADGQTTISFQDVDRDNVATYFFGRLLGFQRREKTTSSFKGFIATFAINSAQFEGTEDDGS